MRVIIFLKVLLISTLQFACEGKRMCAFCDALTSLHGSVDGFCFNKSPMRDCQDDFCYSLLAINKTDSVVKLWRDCRSDVVKKAEVFDDVIEIANTTEVERGNCGAGKELFIVQDLGEEDTKIYNKFSDRWHVSSCDLNSSIHNDRILGGGTFS